MTPEQSAALDVARALAAAGIPVFIARPDPEEPIGFKLPRGWQHARPDPRVVDAWRPGMALAMVCGHGLDLLDIDPRAGGDPAAALREALGGAVPVAYATAVTPSGGVHTFIRSLGVRSRDGVVPGVDVKAGDAEGNGRGFAFIAPTVRRSKVTGEPAAYRWVSPPDLARLAAAGDDTSGAALAELIRAARAGGDAQTAEDFMRTGPWAELAAGTVFRNGRNNGVARLAQALRGRGGWRLEDAIEYMRATVWPHIDQGQGGHPFTIEEFEATITAQWRQYPDGAEQRATPPAPGGPAPNPARYFAKEGGLLAATLANDVLALGPLAQGIDHITWRYVEGVWRPARNAVRDRVAYLMGERYRQHMARTVQDIVAARVPTITCEPVEQYINFRNGLLEWRTGQLHPHSPDVPSTVQLPVDYEPEAQCPAFEKFVAEVVPADMVDTIWELIGYLMYSGNPLHKAVMLTGTGRNGKGTLLRVVTALLGRHNITSVSLHDLVNTRFSTASLFGKLANIAGDIDAGYLEHTATFKAITGGDQISAEHKGRDRFDFVPWAVPVFSANKIPPSADTTVGYLSRWLVVPFPHSFAGREDRTLDRRLTAPAELAGIAARAVRALPALLERGDFAVTDSAQAAREEFVRRVDQVRTWLADCTVPDPDAWTARTELYDAYRRWADRDGYRAVRAGEFYDRLEAAGLVATTIRGVRGFRGVRITDPGFTRLPSAPTPPAPAGPEQLIKGAGDQQQKLIKGAEGAGNSNSVQTAVTSENAPTDVIKGAGGAQISDSVQTGGAEGAGISDSMQRGCPEVDQGCRKTPPEPAPLINKAGNAAEGAESAPPPAPLIKSPSTSGNAAEKMIKGAGGAGFPHPPPRVRARAIAGWEIAAPPAPLINNGRAAGTTAKRAQAILEAAGDRVSLPALVDRSGEITPLPPDKAGRVLAEVIMRGGALTVDVETTGYPVGHAHHRLRTVQLGDEHAAV
ncbi:MAG TPA: phage/plasmid primase, P4 family, partial [Trueperaceae bacterium]